ncbi:hypothetical protein U0070_004846 [Myodes glareolus]|uniref:G protein gamma domain-containing protein n=1 Tax=Myodes glareolus TaxID=447135 RepID=A0AAW0J567_MYOGA
MGRSPLSPNQCPLQRDVRPEKRRERPVPGGVAQAGGRRGEDQGLAAAELQQYCMHNACKDALLLGATAGSNPFRESSQKDKKKLPQMGLLLKKNYTGSDVVQVIRHSSCGRPPVTPLYEW